MTTMPDTPSPFGRALPWLVVGLSGIAVPFAALMMLDNTRAPIIALGLMATGMIGAAVAGSFRTGIVLALMAGAGLIVMALALGMPAKPDPAWLGAGLLIASISFAARGALFARSAGKIGCWIALAIVAGEGAILATALALPGALPPWLLALLPAQWAATALAAALGGSGSIVAAMSLLALGGTAAATLLVARLWPRRWPYLIMFTAWLGLSALVMQAAG